MAFFGRPSGKDDARAEAYRQWLRRRNPLAVASLVLGVFSLIEFGALLVFGVAGIVLGFVALAQLRRVNAAAEAPAPAAPSAAAPPAALGYASSDAPGRLHRRPYAEGEGDDPPVPKTHGHRIAWAGIILSALSLVVAAVIYTRPWERGGP
jgi:hypothetical protein